MMCPFCEDFYFSLRGGCTKILSQKDAPAERALSEGSPIKDALRDVFVLHSGNSSSFSI